MASLKLPIKTSTANTNDIGAQAPSLEQADAILARYGYVDRGELVEA